MIDRDARNAVVAALEDYQLERITAFEFDERIFDVADKSLDQTVRECVDALCGFYDDCTDHRVVAEKYEWDIWERLRLLLLSDAELEAERSGRAKRALLPVCGLVAMLGVVVLVWSVWRGHGVLFALGLYLLLCAVVTWRARASDAATEKKDAPCGARGAGVSQTAVSAQAERAGGTAFMAVTGGGPGGWVSRGADASGNDGDGDRWFGDDAGGLAGGLV